MNPTPRPRELRRARRIPTALVVDLHLRAPQRVIALDVSRHGLLVPTPAPARLSYALAITLNLPSGPVRAMAVVVRHTKTRRGETAMGLSLFGMSTEARRAWEAFILALGRKKDSPELELDIEVAAQGA